MKTSIKNVLVVGIMISVLMFAVSCKKKDDEASPPSNVTGKWIGNWQSAVYSVNGTFVANLIQNGSVLSGTISVPEIGMNNAVLKGTLEGKKITFGDINNQITFTGMFTGGSSVSGTYTYPAIQDNGTWQGQK